MCRTQKLGLALFLLALALLLITLSNPDVDFVFGQLFVIVLVISGLVFAVGLVCDRKKLQRKGKILSLLVIFVAVVFIVPVVETDHGNLQACKINSNTCVNTAQFKSATDFLWCVGAGYQYDSMNGFSLFLEGACHGPIG